MLGNRGLISCNFPTISPLQNPFQNPIKLNALTSSSIPVSTQNFPKKVNAKFAIKLCPSKLKKWCCYSSLNTDDTPKQALLGEEDQAVVGGSDGGGGEERDWSTSLLLFVFWAGLMYYVVVLAPNQTPATDLYFLKKLVNLSGDDGFQMNGVLVALWYIMGLYPLLYSMLLLPSARSSKSRVPVWPFLILSCFGGAYALIPYFVLWRPPPPLIEEEELKRWPLNILESKITAGIAVAAGVGLVAYACSSNGDVWNEFYQYFRGSRFIHVTSIDFSLLSAFAPFWVYNDMTVRKWEKKGSWLLPISIVPVLGPALYLFLRPSLSPALGLLEQQLLSHLKISRIWCKRLCSKYNDERNEQRCCATVQGTMYSGYQTQFEGTLKPRMINSISKDKKQKIRSRSQRTLQTFGRPVLPLVYMITATSSLIGSLG